MGLTLGAVSAGLGAVALDQRPTTAAIGAPEPVTPVLSARRAPELLAVPVGDKRLAAELEVWVTQSPPDSCLLVEASGGPSEGGSRGRLFAHNETQPLAGASTQKLLTATALLLAYGEDARFETVAAASAPASDGILPGDLYLIGGGDPLLTTPEYAEQLAAPEHVEWLGSPGLLTDAGELADAIAVAGIREIQGSVIGDESRYDSERFNPVWPERFRPQNVAGPVGALQLNDGVTGFPKDERLGDAVLPPPDPVQHAAGVLTDLLGQRGVTVAGAPQSGQAPEDATTIATLESVPMREVVAEMLTTSDNHTAEMVFKELGLAELGEGSWEAGAAATESMLAGSGVALDGAQIVDGSGLSIENHVTCRILVDLLERPETGPAVVDGVAVAGQSGTLRNQLNGTPIEGRLRAKTGSVRTVTALAGQASPLAGGSLTFAYVATVPEPQQFSDDEFLVRGGLAEILTSYPRDVDLGALSPVGVSEPEN